MTNTCRLFRAWWKPNTPIGNRADDQPRVTAFIDDANWTMPVGVVVEYLGPQQKHVPHCSVLTCEKPKGRHRHSGGDSRSQGALRLPRWASVSKAFSMRSGSSGVPSFSVQVRTAVVAAPRQAGDHDLGLKVGAAAQRAVAEGLEDHLLGGDLVGPKALAQGRGGDNELVLGEHRVARRNRRLAAVLRALRCGRAQGAVG